MLVILSNIFSEKNIEGPSILFSTRYIILTRHPPQPSHQTIVKNFEPGQKEFDFDPNGKRWSLKDIFGSPRGRAR